MNNRGRLSRCISLLLLATILLLSLSSCDSLEGVLDHAGNAAENAGDVLKDIVQSGETGAEGEESSGRLTPRPPRPTGSITTGPVTIASSQIIEPSGGTVSVENSSDPLNGLSLNIPPGSYPATRQVNVSHAPVVAHSFGEYFNPTTPLITIENGGGYSEEFMTVRIPIDVPADHFAMAFYYDDETGTLEGIPFAGVDDDSVTIVTRHFSGFLVSIIRNSVLDDLMKGDIDSHFRPGIDDWQFPNFGSYIAAGGHCAGQCLSALWYYCEQPDGQDRTLNGRYDKNGVQPVTPDLWEDDSHGYRLASTVQHDINWSSFENELMANLAGVNDSLTFKAFAYAIQLTGEPQEVGIFASAGGGHDMICYRIYKNSLYIADPNYPGNTDRRIEFVNGSFKPYESGANATEIANGNSTTYETIEYCAKSATVDWNLIGRRWSELKAGTIGNDVFPAYELVVVADDGSETALVDGFEAQQKRIEIWGKGRVPLATKVFLDGVRIQRDAEDKYELHEGKNVIGISIWGDANNNPQDRNYEYIDFKYFEVQYGTEECSGWVLDSVTTRDEFLMAEDPYTQDLRFTSSDGAFSASGRYLVYQDPEVFARHTCSGTWALPTCIQPNEPVSVQLQLSSTVDYDQAIDFKPDHYAYLVFTDYAMTRLGLSLSVNQDAPTAQQSEVATFMLDEGSEEWATVEFTMQCGYDAGSIKYVYTYVWRG